MAEEKRKVRRRKEQEILDAGEELFLRFGLRKVTVEDICKRAGCSKMTFYKYFGNKIELFKIMLEEMFEEAFKEVDGLKDMSIPFTEKVDHLLGLKKIYADKFSPELIEEILQFEGDLAVYYQQLAGRSMGRFVEFIRYCQEKGEVRQDMKPEFFLAILNHLAEWVLQSDLHKLYPTYTDFALEVNRFLYYGILPLDRRK